MFHAGFEASIENFTAFYSLGLHAVVRSNTTGVTRNVNLSSCFRNLQKTPPEAHNMSLDKSG